MINEDPLKVLHFNEEEKRRFQGLRLKNMAAEAKSYEILQKTGFLPVLNTMAKTDIGFLLDLLERALNAKK